MANRADELKARLQATFQVEAEEHLQVIAANLHALERELPTPSREIVDATFREVHTLKGAARSVSMSDVEMLCQAWESILSKISHGHLPLNSAILKVFREAADGLTRSLGGGVLPLPELILALDQAGQALGRVASQAEEPRDGARQASLPKVAAALQTTQTIRLAAGKLDTLLLQAEDLLVPKLANAERRREAGALVEALGECRAQVGRLRQSHGRGDATEIDASLRAIEGKARDLQARLARDQEAITGVVDGLIEGMREVRMTRAGTVLDLFPGMVSDLARELGKDAECVVHGAELEVDRKVLDAMKDPLIHVVRNAVDHGIEAAEIRRKAGKKPQGCVTVTVTPLENHRIDMRVEDDGCGTDIALLKTAAVRARLLTSEAAEALTDAEAMELLYRSGFSTSPIITNLSGHGLGLAIVKERVENLGGRLQVESRAGAGMTVRMILPAAIATFQGLLVKAGGQLFLLPTESVERAVRVSAESVERVEGQEAIRWSGRPLFVAHLSDLLGCPHVKNPGAAGRSCVIVEVGGERVGLFVEEVLGNRELLVKELQPPLVRVRNVAGAGLLGTGQVVLILRMSDLLKSMRFFRRAQPASAPLGDKVCARVLVVDDSITTRTMEKNLLEAAGYVVKTAIDGLDAWTTLKSEAFDLVVSDVDMPRMDGLDLTAKIRGDAKLAELPVILVTALESREDKERGIEVGANAYIVKSSFDQSNLLEIIRRLT